MQNCCENIALDQLPNIGKVLAHILEEVEIHSPADLIKCGSENAFLRITALENTACLHKLFALEGAIQNTRWHNLSTDRKNELRQFFNIAKMKRP